jgi:hypothetical protein
MTEPKARFRFSPSHQRIYEPRGLAQQPVSSGVRSAAVDSAGLGGKWQLRSASVRQSARSPDMEALPLIAALTATHCDERWTRLLMFVSQPVLYTGTCSPVPLRVPSPLVLAKTTLAEFTFLGQPPLSEVGGVLIWARCRRLVQARLVHTI